jgi:DNA-directed RNA polymerase beta subunit
VAALSSAVGDATTFMTEENPHYNMATILKEQYGFEPYGNEVMYNGQTGEMIPTSIFIAPLYQMRLKHMVEDKWNARAEGRREQKTHQPTGGRGNQGGLRIGEMERDAIIAHGGAEFIDETYMKRADGSEIILCNSCGTVPIYNEKENLFFCSLCDGPAVFVGDSAENLSLIPSPHKSDVTFSKVRIPYSMKLLDQEFNTYLNTHREKYNSLFLTNYRESNTIARKRISFGLVYEICNYLLPSILV